MTFQIADEREESRYAAYVDDRAAGYAEWILVRGTVLVPRVEAGPSHHSQGIGSMLLRRILDDARAEGNTVLPLCPFAQRWTELHPEYRGTVRKPMPGEIAALQSALATASERRRSWSFDTAAVTSHTQPA
jgi:uncharacterized protein